MGTVMNGINEDENLSEEQKKTSIGTMSPRVWICEENNCFVKEDKVTSLWGLPPPYIKLNEKICVMDIDVQGHELHVLMGLAKPSLMMDS